jgi:simple sugar transport system ATP-binding protein
VHANAGISILVDSGVIQGILGENGAGKSTLMKILSGFIRPDSGQILLDGAEVTIHSPADAIRVGVGMLHQDPLDFPPMTLVDNFLLGKRSRFLPDRRAAAVEFSELATRFGFQLSPDSYVDMLTVGERQQLEILRLLSLGARVLILDEPTTGISLPQKETLFSTLKALATQGMSVLFVSHKLEDVEALCSRVAVLRQGELVGNSSPPFDTRNLVEMMFGKEVPASPRLESVPGDVTLNLEAVSIEEGRLTIPRVSLEVRTGEVIGLAGMEGSGQSQLLSVCAGLLRPVSGRILFRGRNLTRQSHLTYRREGVAYLPAARLERALVPGMTLSDHFILSEGMRGLFVNRKKANDIAEKRIAAFNIKGIPESTVESLSGGNQQRMLLALLRAQLSLILLEHPTRGLDIESSVYVWSRLKERCESGTSVIFVSTDLDEIIQYSDRIVVCYAGRVSPPLDARTVTVDSLGRLIGGKGWEQFDREPVNEG